MAVRRVPTSAGTARTPCRVRTAGQRPARRYARTCQRLPTILLAMPGRRRLMERRRNCRAACPKRHSPPYNSTRRSLTLYESLIRMRVREVLADVAHVDLPGPAGVIVIVDPGGDEALPGYLEMRIHENGAVRMYVAGDREDPQLPEFG